MLDFGDEYFRDAIEAMQELGELIEKWNREYIEQLNQEFEKLAAEKFFEREPIPETPYIFRGQPRVFDKRPHKQHKCRNNC